MKEEDHQIHQFLQLGKKPGKKRLPQINCSQVISIGANREKAKPVSLRRCIKLIQ